MSQGTQAFLRGETESEDFAGAPARCPVRIGDRFRRTAPGYTAEDGFNRITLMWTVIYINAAHRYYTAEAEVYGYRMRESWKF